MSGTMHLTLPGGSSVELPPKCDVHRLNPSLCADFPGHGMRPKDTRCIRCAREENLAHRQNLRSCSRVCFLCGTKAHIGKACPKMVHTVNIWWWRLRGYVGCQQQKNYLPTYCPKLPDRPLEDVLSSPPGVMLKALNSTMSPDDKVTASNQLRAAEQMGTTANKLLYDLGEMVRGLPQEMFGQEVLDGMTHTAALSSNLKKESDRMLLLVTKQLQHTMRQALGIRSQTSVPGTVPSLHDGADDLASNADFVGHLADTGPTAPQFWEPPSYRFHDHGGLVVSQDDNLYAIDTSQPLIQNGAGFQKDGGPSRESRQPYWSALLRMYHSRPLQLDGPAAVVVETVPISADERRRLYVGNLPFTVTKDELRDFFGGFSIESVTMPHDPKTTRAVDYAFVKTSTASEALRVIEKLNGKYILDRKVLIKHARPNIAGLAPGELSDAIDQLIDERKGKGKDTEHED